MERACTDAGVEHKMRLDSTSFFLINQPYLSFFYRCARMKTERRRRGPTRIIFTSTYWTWGVLRDRRVNCFADEMGKRREKRGAYHRRASHASRSTLASAFHLIGALLFHITDPPPPQEQRLSAPTTNHFRIMQMISTAEKKLHARCPSIQRCLQFQYMFFLPSFSSLTPPPPIFSLHTYE